MPTHSNVVLVNAGKKVRVIAQCVKFKDGKKVTTQPMGRIIHICNSVCHSLSNFCPIWHRLLSPNFRWYLWGPSSPSRSRTRAFLRSSVKMAAVSDALKVSVTLPEGRFWTEKQIAPSLFYLTWKCCHQVSWLGAGTGKYESVRFKERRHRNNPREVKDNQCGRGKYTTTTFPLKFSLKNSVKEVFP